MVKKIFARTYIGLMLALLYAPIILLIVLSFTTARTFGSWTGFSLDNYSKLFQNSGVGSAVANTLVIALISAVIATFMGAFAAVGIYNMRKVTKTAVNTINQIPVMNADIVTALSLFVFFSMLGFGGGYVQLIICHVLICTPYVVLSVMPRLMQLNPNLYEAALDLGASPTRALFKVILPQLIPGMISGALLAFTLSLDDFVITNYNKGSSGVETISTYIYTHTKRGLDPSFRALSAIIFLIILGCLLAVNLRAARAKAAKRAN